MGSMESQRWIPRPPHRSKLAFKGLRPTVPRTLYLSFKDRRPIHIPVTSVFSDDVQAFPSGDLRYPSRTGGLPLLELSPKTLPLGHGYRVPRDRVLRSSKII